MKRRSTLLVKSQRCNESLFKTKERSHGTSDTPAFASQSCWRNEKEWKVFPRELGAATIY